MADKQKAQSTGVWSPSSMKPCSIYRERFLMHSPNRTEFAPNAACRLKDVIRITGLSRSTIYGRINKTSSQFDPTFPRPFPLYGGAQLRGAKGWRVHEINAWLDADRKSTRLNSSHQIISYAV